MRHTSLVWKHVLDMTSMKIRPRLRLTDRLDNAVRCLDPAVPQLTSGEQRRAEDLKARILKSGSTGTPRAMTRCRQCRRGPDRVAARRDDGKSWPATPGDKRTMRHRLPQDHKPGGNRREQMREQN